MFVGPLFKSENGKIKEKVMRFVFFMHTVHIQDKEKKRLIQIILVWKRLAPSEQFCSRRPKS